MLCCKLQNTVWSVLFVFVNKTLPFELYKYEKGSHLKWIKADFESIKVTAM